MSRIKLRCDQKKEIFDSKKFNTGNYFPTIKTGYENLDNLLGGGFTVPSFVVIGGRPAMGKTMVMLNLLKNISENTKCTWLTLEEPSDFSMNRYKTIQSDMKNVYFTNIFSFEECVKEIRDFHEKGHKVFFVDYFQLLNGCRENIYENASFISHELKKISIQLNICIIVSSQLSRKCDERASRHPVLTDLRDSGTLEEDADVVLLLLRNDYYDPADFPGRIKVIVAKSRYSNTGVIHLERQNQSIFSVSEPKFKF